MADFLMVSGFHRGGTSVCAKICADIGLLPGFSILGPSPENPTGFFEHIKVLEANQKAIDLAKKTGWLYPKSIDKIEPAFVKAALVSLQIEKATFCKDPRFLNSAAVWLPHFSKTFGQTKVLITLRSPEAVAKSIGKRNNIPTTTVYFWMLSLLWSFVHSLRYCSHEILFVDFEKWGTDGAQEKRVSEFVGRPIFFDKQQSWLDSKRQISPSNDRDPLLEDLKLLQSNLPRLPVKCSDLLDIIKVCSADCFFQLKERRMVWYQIHQKYHPSNIAGFSSIDRYIGNFVVDGFPSC
jgi:hypothetical protein